MDVVENATCSYVLLSNSAYLMNPFGPSKHHPKYLPAPRWLKRLSDNLPPLELAPDTSSPADRSVPGTSLMGWKGVRLLTVAALPVGNSAPKRVHAMCRRTWQQAHSPGFSRPGTSPGCSTWTSHLTLILPPIAGAPLGDGLVRSA